MLQYAATISGCTSLNEHRPDMFEMTWIYVRYPRCICRSRATTATWGGTSTTSTVAAAASESPAECEATPRQTGTAQRGEARMVRFSTEGHLLHKIFSNASEKMEESNCPVLFFYIFWGLQLDWLSLPKLVAVHDLRGYHFRNSNNWK